MPKRPKRKTTNPPDREQSFGSILDEVSFRPLGRRIKVKPGKSHIGLRMRRKIESASEFRGNDGNGQ